MKINCRILCFNYSLYDVRCKKTINSDIKSQCMHICAVKFIHNTLKGFPHDILCLVKKRRQNKKKRFQSGCGTSNHRKFHIIFFHLNSRSQYSCKQTGNGKGSHLYRYSFVIRSVCRFLRQKLSGSPCLTLCAQKGGVPGGAKLVNLCFRD